jgi:hypothetical protein
MPQYQQGFRLPDTGVQVMQALLLSLLLGASPFVVPPPTGVMSGRDITSLDDAYGTCMTSDAAPSPVTVVTDACVYPVPGSTYTTGADIVLSGSPGAINLTGVTKAGTAGDTLLFQVRKNDGTSSIVTLTEGAGAGQWNCAGAATDIACVCNLYTLVTAHATLGSIVQVARTDATCSDEKLFFGVVPGASYWLDILPSDTANTVLVKGTYGKTLVGRLASYATPDEHGFAPPNQTADKNAKSLYVHAENVAADATAARTAGNLVLAPAFDSKTLVFDDANPDTGAHCPGTTLTLRVNGTSNVLTYNTYCAAGCATQAAACAALSAAIEALAGVGATCGTITGGASNAVLVTADQPATYDVAWTAETASCTTYSNGTDGQILVGDGLVGTPAIAFAQDPTTGWYRYNSGGISTSSGGAFSSYISTSYFQAAGGARIGWQSKADWKQTSLNIVTLGADVGSNNVTHQVFLGAPAGTGGTGTYTNKGAKSLLTINTATITFAAGGEATKTATGLIPLGAVSHQITGYVLVTADAGSCTTFHVGNTAAADPDMYAASVPIAAAQTFGPGVASYSPTAQPLSVQITAAGDVVLTSVGGAAACKNLSVRISAHYRIDTPDTGA